VRVRSECSAHDIEALYQHLDKKLDAIGMETQPEVAARIMELTSDADAGPVQYAEVLKNDPAISGRLIRMANSVYFAQRQPVTNVERSCVVLGLSRLKAVSLGFYLTQSAIADGDEALARRVWAQSLFRACLAVKLSEQLVPRHSAEAFVIGLLLDAGVPLMMKLIGEEYRSFIEPRPAPIKLYNNEFDKLPFTHADVVVAMARRWRLPELLAKPLAWRYTRPGRCEGETSLQKLQRIAYYVGAIDLESPSDEIERPPQVASEEVLGLNEQKLGEAFEKASAEYEVTAQAFAEHIESIDDLEKISAAAHNQLVGIVDRALTGPIEGGMPESATFEFDGFMVEISPREDGTAVAYLIGTEGVRIVSFNFEPKQDEPIAVLDHLGVDEADPEEYARFEQYMTRLAA